MSVVMLVYEYQLSPQKPPPCILRILGNLDQFIMNYNLSKVQTTDRVTSGPFFSPGPYDKTDILQQENPDDL